MMAICPAGPPKLMKPSLSQKRRKPSPWATAIGSRLPAMPVKKIDGLSSTSTRLKRASNCSLLLRVNFGQASAPGMIGASAAIIWQPLHTPSAKVSGLAKKAWNCPASFGLNITERAQPSPAPSVSP
jgi:hypothetical protein